VSSPLENANEWMEENQGGVEKVEGLRPLLLLLPPLHFPFCIERGKGLLEWGGGVG